MSIGNLKDQGNKGNNFPYQLAVLKLLDQINSSITALPGVDYETRTTTYQATAAGPGYSIGDILVRYDIINVNTGLVATTVWFNQTTQAVIVAPAPGNITPYLPPGNVTVTNPFNLEATQLLVLAAILSGNTTQATEATLSTINTILGNTLDVLLSSRASEVTLSAFNTKYTNVSRTPSVVNVPASSVGSTTAGVQELSILVIGGGNTVGGVSIPSGTILNYKAKAGDTVGAIAYTTGAGANRLILSYLT